jgi:hypothetical protein
MVLTREEVFTSSSCVIQCRRVKTGEKGWNHGGGEVKIVDTGAYAEKGPPREQASPVPWAHRIPRRWMVTVYTNNVPVHTAVGIPQVNGPTNRMDIMRNAGNRSGGDPDEERRGG